MNYKDEDTDGRTINLFLYVSNCMENLKEENVALYKISQISKQPMIKIEL